MSITLNASPKMCLDTWMEYFAINPLAFNNIDVINCMPDYSPGTCSQYWRQYQFETDAFSKEQLGFYIQTAEQQIENYLGSFIKPTWVCQEEHPLPYYYERKRGHPRDLYNIKFQTNWKNVIAFGQPIKNLLQISPITYVDEDGDGFTETAIVNFTLSDPVDLTCPNNFKLYFTDRDGNSHYEICSYRSFDYDNNTLDGTIVFDSWILLNPDLYLQKSFLPQRTYDGCDLNNFVSDIEIWFEEINDCLPQAEVVWSKHNYQASDVGWAGCYICGRNCNCQEYRRPACVKILDYCKGIFSIELMDYDEDTGCVIQGSCRCLPCTPPDSIRINYISGCNQCHSQPNNNLCNDDICADLIKPIIMLSITNMPKTTCSCKCIQQQLDYWAEDLAFKPGSQIGTVGTYNYPLKFLEMSINGVTKRGAIEATMLLENFKDSYKMCYNFR